VASYILSITGASGAVYGVRLLEELLGRGHEVDLLITPTARIILGHELGVEVKTGPGGSVVLSAPGGETGGPLLRYIEADDLSAGPASGSSLRRNMIICPCSMGTLARIASGVSGNLVERAADCVLKERGRLVLVPRETPLHAIHLENMLRLARTGAIILPAMPGFYHGPRTLDDLVNFIVGKVLDALEIENDLYKRWDGEG
jgi:4-hydroxy-3-polyprenylbenzoate decarboxylase